MRRKVLALRGPILRRPGWRTFAGISALTFVAADDTVGQTPGSCDPEPRMPPAGYRFNVVPRAERYPPGRPVVGPPGIPGGFGGLYWGHEVLRDPSHEHGRPVVWLLDTTQRVAALAALAGQLRGARPQDVIVRQGRWDAAELFIWNHYLHSVGWGRPRNLTTWGIDERRNRIMLGVIDSATLHRINRRLLELGVPCDMVHVRLSPPVVTLPARPANRERRSRPPE